MVSAARAAGERVRESAVGGRQNTSSRAVYNTTGVRERAPVGREQTSASADVNHGRRPATNSTNSSHIARAAARERAAQERPTSHIARAAQKEQDTANARGRSRERDADSTRRGPPVIRQRPPNARPRPPGNVCVDQMPAYKKPEKRLSRYTDGTIEKDIHPLADRSRSPRAVRLTANPAAKESARQDLKNVRIKGGARHGGVDLTPNNHARGREASPRASGTVRLKPAQSSQPAKTAVILAAAKKSAPNVFGTARERVTAARDRGSASASASSSRRRGNSASGAFPARVQELIDTHMEVLDAEDVEFRLKRDLDDADPRSLSKNQRQARRRDLLRKHEASQNGV